MSMLNYDYPIKYLRTMINEVWELDQYELGCLKWVAWCGKERARESKMENDAWPNVAFYQRE